MSINIVDYDYIRQINIDEHSTTCAFEYWEDEFPQGTYIFSHLGQIKKRLGLSFTRSQIVEFYRKSDIEPETKFIAAMIWGHEAPAGSRRDSRGPWKLSKMFNDPTIAEDAIRSVSVENPQSIMASYKLLNKALDKCGPNFLTKHLYFLGKSKGLHQYPLIFDDRVANGIVKLSMSDQSNLGMVRVSAARKPEEYLKYLSYVYAQAELIGCELDQIEYFLFTR